MRKTDFRCFWRRTSVALGAVALLVLSSGNPAQAEPVVPAASNPTDALLHTAAMPATATAASAEERQAAARMLARQPMSFVRNDGQVDPRVSYYAWRGGFASYFTPEEAMLVFREPTEKEALAEPRLEDDAQAGTSPGLALALSYLGANPDVRIEGRERTPGHYNFLVGTDPSNWRRNVPGFAGVIYRDLWPGIDMTFREHEGRLKYSFVVHPGADPNRIRLAYRGSEGLSLRDDGALLIATELGAMVDERPVSWQVIDGRKRLVETSFRLADAAEGPAFRFALEGTPSPELTLVIDPGLVFSTYLDGRGFEEVFDLALDSLDRPVVVGPTFSSNFPTTAGAFDTGLAGLADAFVTKLSADGSALEFSTFLGGGSSEAAFDVALDSLDRPVVVGLTRSSDFPTTAGAFDTGLAGPADAFVTKLSADGSALEFSTLLGGGSFDRPLGIALDSLDRPVVLGQTFSSTFPTTADAFDTIFNGGADAFVTRLSADGSALEFSTFLGGGGLEEVFDLALDSLDRPVVVGQTFSSNFPTTAGAFDTGLDGSPDAFVTKLSADGSALEFSTFLGGGSSDVAFGVALDSSDRPVVVGQTHSFTFPVTAGAFDTAKKRFGVAFVTKLTAVGSALEFSTFLGGGGGSDVALGVALDSSDRPVVVGQTGSSDFPTTAGAFDTIYNGGADAFVTRLSADGSALVDSSYFGGSGFERAGFFGGGVSLDGAGNIYIGGQACSLNFPTTPGAFQETFIRLCGAFVAKFGEENQPPVADAGPDQEVACTSATATDVTLDGSGSSDPDGDPLTYSWTKAFGTATGVSPTVSLGLGTSTITLEVSDGALTDTDTVDITVAVQVEGFFSPLAALVREGTEPPLPNTAFRQKSSLPLKLQLFCGTQELTDVEVSPPKIFGLLAVDDAPVNLETVDPDSGEAHDSGFEFRYSTEDSQWIYNLSTNDLSAGNTYEITIEMPDGLLYAGRFALK